MPKPDVTPPATQAPRPLAADHDLVAQVTPDKRRTDTSHRVTQSLTVPLRHPGHPSGSAVAPSLSRCHRASVGGMATAAGLFSSANHRRFIYSTLIPAGEPILGRCSSTRAAQIILTQRWFIFGAALLRTCSGMVSNCQALTKGGEARGAGEEGLCKEILRRLKLKSAFMAKLPLAPPAWDPPSILGRQLSAG